MNRRELRSNKVWPSRKLLLSLPLMTRVLVTAISASLLQSCAHSAEQQGNRQLDAQVFFGWVNCDSPSNLYFSISSSSDLVVLYHGNSEVRTLGDRTYSGSLNGYRKLSAAANDVRSADVGTPGAPHTSPAQEENSSPYCLLVRSGKAGTQTIVNLASPIAKRFIKVADDAVNFRALACPGRDFKFFGSENGCSAPELSMVYDTAGQCRIRHVVHLYKSGVAHYYAEDVRNSDQYADITRRDFQAFESKVSSFDTSRSLSVEGDIPTPLRGTEAELSQFRALVASKVNFKWLELENGDARCLPQLEPSQLQRWITK